VSDLTGRLVLPAAVRLVPVASLAPSLRGRLGGGAVEEVVLLYPGSRTPSRLVDAGAAELLEGFRSPATVAEAVLRFCRARGRDAEATLEEAYPLLRRLAAEEFLVEEGSTERTATGPTLARGETFAGWEVLAAVQRAVDIEVYQVRREGSFAALKVGREGQAGGGAAAGLDWEASILEHLGGECAPRLIDQGEEGGRPWLALEWLPGVDVGRRAAEVRADEEDLGREKAALLDLARRVCEAYADLHAKDVVHGDVQPANALMDGEGWVRLVDFGAAGWADGPGALTPPARAGVAYYFAPEYARNLLGGGDRPPGPPSELEEQYAVAALVYTLATGSPVRDFPLLREAMLREIAEEPPLTFAARGAEPWPAFEEILARALAKEPAERYPSMADFATALAALARPVASPAARGAGEAGRALLALTFERLRPDGLAFLDPEPPAPSATVGHGAAGVAYALLRLAQLRSDSELLTWADLWAAKAARRMATPAGLYSVRWGLTPAVVGAISPLHSSCGLPLVAAALARAQGEPEREMEAVAQFLSTVAPLTGNETSLDLTLGLSGVLLAIARLLPGAAAPARAALAARGAELSSLLTQQLLSRPPIGLDSATPSLGMAHGWGGFLYALLRWHRAAGVEVSSSLRLRLGELAALAEPWGRGARFRCYGEDGADLGALTGWCNGSAGFVFLWEEAFAAFGETLFRDLAAAAAWHVWEGPDDGFDLCCGATGRAYALLRWFRRSGDSEWLARARRLGEQSARSALPTLNGREAAAATRPDAAHESLLRGALGVAILAAELEHPDVAALPFFAEDD
jgi:serine/threonine-protein kinase